MSATASYRPLRRLAAVVFAVLLIGTSLAIGQASSATADPVTVQSGELVVNGDAEQLSTVGWTGSLSWARHGVSGYAQSVIVNAGGATGATFPGGTALFAGVGGSSTASQTIDLTPSAAAIDNGNVNAFLSAYVGGYAAQLDNAKLTYAFRNASAATLATVVFGPVTAADRGKVSGFIGFSQTQHLPVGTRSVVVTITTQRSTAPANDGYVDNVSLILDAPSPVATPDTANTDQGVPVTLTPYSNDTAGAGAVIVPSSVRLLDGSVPVTALTTVDGSYVVDTATGDVVFTPVGGFIGATAAVPYRVTDSSGQNGVSTITVTVTVIAAPELTLTKSAAPADQADFTLGTVITYSFVVANTGNVPIDNLVIDDPPSTFTGSGTLPAATCPVTTLAPGAYTTCSTQYTLTAADVAAHGVANTATASGTPSGSATPIDSNSSSFAVPVVPQPAITLAKTANAAGATGSGDTVEYSFLVTNTGNVAVDTVSIVENAFSGTGTVPSASCPSVTLLPGAFTSCTARYALTQPDVDAGTVSNTATALAVAASGGTVSSSQSSVSVTIGAAPAFTFVKSADRASITAAGQAILYTFRITNTGNVTLSNPVIKEATFTGAGALSAVACPATSVAPTSRLDCTARYVTVAADLDEANISNSATADVSDPKLNALSSGLSSVAIPLVLPDPGTGTDPGSGTDPGAGTDPGTGQNGPGTAPVSSVLAVTGVDALPPAFFAAALLLAGFGLLGAALLSRRVRTRRAD